MHPTSKNTSKLSGSNSKKELNIKNDLNSAYDDKVISDPIWFNFSKKMKDCQQNGKKGKSIDTPYKRWGHSSLHYKNAIIVFGGRHSSRSLVNIYAFDLENYFWYKLDALGQTPAARDSHSAVIVIICFLHNLILYFLDFFSLWNI